MKEYPLAEEQEKINEHIFAQAQGLVLRLEAVPTATVPLLKEDEWGSYENVLYHRVDDVVLVFTPSSTIDISNDEV